MGKVLENRRKQKRFQPNLKWVNLGSSVLFRLEVRRCYGLTSRNALYRKIARYSDECPVMPVNASLYQPIGPGEHDSLEKQSRFK
jgi:hypothetical protein